MLMFKALAFALAAFGTTAALAHDVDTAQNSGFARDVDFASDIDLAQDADLATVVEAQTDDAIADGSSDSTLVSRGSKPGKPRGRRPRKCYGYGCGVSLSSLFSSPSSWGRVPLVPLKHYVN
jgi:hypothetical protein